ncbi:MAG: DUF3343 domain-containing protein [Anaerolineae bacterium]
MQETSYGVLLFDSTQAALRAEKILKAEGLTVKLIPVPRQLSSDCGISLRFPFAQVDVVEATLAAKGLPVAGIHRI